MNATPKVLSIVLLGWGSLTYDWAGLALEEPVRWRRAGLDLRIEFSRKSTRGPRVNLLTAVIDPTCPKLVPVRMSITTYTTVAAARQGLMVRERTDRPEWIGSIDREGHVLGTVSSDLKNAIHNWILATPHDAVVWTAIPPDFGGREFTIPAAIRHFCDLDSAKKQDARNYIARAPDEIDTPLRQALREAGLLDGADPRPIDIAVVWPD